MNLLRRTHPGASLTTGVVLMCGIVSGAALAAGNRPGELRPMTSTLGTIPSPATPTVGGIPGIPAVPNPTVRLPWMRQDVPAPQPVAAPTQAAGAEVQIIEDALVLRPETKYERSTLRPVVPTEPAAVVEEAPLSLASGKPLGGLNMNGLVLFMLAMLGGVGFFTYRKKREQLIANPNLTLEVASTIRVGNRWQVSLVRVPGKILVVGSTDKGLELLTELYTDGDEDAMDDLLAMASHPEPQPSGRTQAAPMPVAATAPATAEGADGADVFDALADVSPRYDAPPSGGVYGRPGRRQAAAPEPTPSAKAGHDDVFLDAVLERLQNARPAVIRQATTPTPRVDERAALRAQAKQYRRGPTRL